MATITIRPGIKADHPLVLDSFLHAYGRSCYGSGVPARVLLSKMEALLASPSWTLSVACLPEEPDEILGFVVWRPEVVSDPTPSADPFTLRVFPLRQAGAVAWLQVKELYRRRGIARALWEHAGPHGDEVLSPFAVPDAVAALRRDGIRLRFRPYMPEYDAASPNSR